MHFKRRKTITCDNCSSRSSSIFLKNIASVEGDEVFNIERCNRCGLAYVNPRPLKKNISDYYPQKDYWDKNADPRRAYSYLLGILRPRTKTGKILDIGAGTGLFLSLFKKNGWITIGVEVSETAVKIARKNYAVVLKKGEFANNKFPKNYFDVVTLNNVLEHLYNPKETLTKIRGVLKNGGIVLISVPNLESVGFKLFKKNWYGLDIPRHLYHFTPSTLKKMVIGCGFEVVNIHHGYWYHNFAALFESFRRFSSPRIKMKKSTNYKKINSDLKRNQIYQLIKNIIVIASKLIFCAITFFEPVFQRGEIFVLEAKRK